MSLTSEGSKFGLVEALQTRYADSKDSHITIRCKDRDFEADPLVLITQSSYFKACVKDGFKEKDQNLIEIDHIEAEVFEAVLRYFYALDYEVKSETDELAFHAKVYAAAEYFGLSILKNNAATKFEKAIDKRVNIPGGISFATAENVYQGTADNDRVLRDLFIRAIYDKPTAFDVSSESQQDQLHALFECVPEFAVDFMRLHSGSLIIAPRLSTLANADSQCYKCNQLFLMSEQSPIYYTDRIECPNKSCRFTIFRSKAKEAYNSEKQRRLDLQ